VRDEMKKYELIFLFGIIAIISTKCTSSTFSNFVTRKDDKVFDGEKEIRFISFNIPTLHYNEDYLPFESTNPWRLPDEFEIKDALMSIKKLGSKVARIYVFSLRKKDEPKEYIRHIEGPGEFNEEAFRALDKVLQIANQLGVRIIIPLVDNWHWWGGPMDYAAFRKKTHREFWTDTLLISDFKKTIDYVLNRKNYYTGIFYKEDKSIFAWETGNELQAPFSWTKEIAAYIKSIDGNHLLLDGGNARDLRPQAIEDPNLDIMSTHYTPIPNIIANQKLVKGKKPYLIGEYGLMPTNLIEAVSDTIIKEGLLGGMLWSLRNRNRDGGFYKHFERGFFDSYHYPGFPSGDLYDESLVFELVKRKSSEISGDQKPVNEIPEPPTLLDIKNVSEISWQGSVGALYYSVERKEEYSSNWKVIADSVDETQFQYKPLFNDEMVVIGERYFYRVRAKNKFGESDCSNIIGPVDVGSKKIVDEFINLEKVFEKSDSLKLLTFEDLRKAKEDRSRLTGKDSSYIVYKVQGIIIGITAEAFLPKENSNLVISVSSDGLNYRQISVSSEQFIFTKNDYEYFTAVRFKSNMNLTGQNYFRILLFGNIQLSRLEIEYK
jgi:mannan endo-1,4-beta-mannosidase